MRTRIRQLAIGASCAAALTGVAGAQGVQDDMFRAGLDAREKRQWQQVATHMRRAIAADPKESTRQTRSGLGALFRRGGDEYLPHFFLGEALFQLDNCPEAIREWALSEQQGALAIRPDLATIVQKSYAQCAARGTLPPAEFDPLVAATDQQIATVTAFSQRLSRVARGRPEVWQGGMRAQFDQVGLDLQAARDRLAAAISTRSRQDFVEAGEAANRVAAALRGFETVLQAASDVSGALEAGARSYFAGEYEQVLAALAEPRAAVAGVPLRAHAHLFRAAALYALYVRSGETDDGRRAAAVADVAACRQLAPALQPDPRAFGPRFVRFFETAALPSGAATDK